MRPWRLLHVTSYAFIIAARELGVRDANLAFDRAAGVHMRHIARDVFVDPVPLLGPIADGNPSIAALYGVQGAVSASAVRLGDLLYHPLPSVPTFMLRSFPISS